MHYREMGMKKPCGISAGLGAWDFLEYFAAGDDYVTVVKYRCLALGGLAYRR